MTQMSKATEKWAKVLRNIQEVCGISSTREMWTRNKNLGYINLLIIFEFTGLDEFVIEGEHAKKLETRPS